MKSNYYSTHHYLVDHFEDLPEDYITHLLSKKHPVRNIQDRYCYIHAKTNNVKIFTPKQHKRLEEVTRNNLKLFVIVYVKSLPDSDIDILMEKEAIHQFAMLKRMSFNHVLYCRVAQINFFLNYSYSRSYDHFVKVERFSSTYSKHILGIDPEKRFVPCLQM